MTHSAKQLQQVSAHVPMLVCDEQLVKERYPDADFSRTKFAVDDETQTAAA